jgi:hypothetical protein
MHTQNRRGNETTKKLMRPTWAGWRRLGDDWLTWMDEKQQAH